MSAMPDDVWRSQEKGGCPPGTGLRAWEGPGGLDPEGPGLRHCLSESRAGTGWERCPGGTLQAA